MNAYPRYDQTCVDYINWHTPATQFERAITEARRSADHAAFMDLARQCLEQMDAINKILERCLASAGIDTQGG